MNSVKWMKQAGIVLIIRDISMQVGPIQREILVTTNRHYGQYSLPGGKVENSDPDPRFTARRELREETGVVLVDSDMTFLFKAVNTVTGEDREVHMFFARAIWGQPKNIEPGTDFAWMTFHQLLDSSVFAPFYKRHLPDGIEHLVTTAMVMPQ